MALSITMCDAAEVNAYETTNVAVGFTDAMKDDVGFQAEAFLVVLTKYDLVTNWASLDAVSKIICTEYVARTIAVAAIIWDMSSFTSIAKLEYILNIHLTKLAFIERLLEDQNYVDIVKNI